MIHWLRKRSLLVRILAYVAAATFAFAVAAGMGGLGALMLREDLALTGNEKGKAARSQEEDGADQQEKVAPKQSEAEYASKVGQIQARSVEAFLDNHDKLLSYDALTAADVEKMKGNVAALLWFTIQVDELRPPQEYEEQHSVFRSAIAELHEATQLAYRLAADPTAATQSDFEEYDSLVNEAASDLQRSNEMLERDFETIEDVQRTSPLS